MNQILSSLAGAAIMVVVGAVWWATTKAWKGCVALTDSFRKVGEGIRSLKDTNDSMLRGFNEVSVQLKKLSGELEFLRTVMTTGAPPEEGAQGQAGPPVAPRRPPAGPVAQFPAWQPFVAAVDAPDAEESDTEIIDTSDEELAEMEAIDLIRGQGHAAGPEADPMENPPGVTANV